MRQVNATDQPAVRPWAVLLGVLALALNLRAALAGYPPLLATVRLLLPLPLLVGPWLWVVLLGVAGGAGFPLGLAMIAWRAPDAAASSATGGLALGVGYLAAGTGLLAAAALQAFAIARIGDPPAKRQQRQEGAS